MQRYGHALLMMTLWVVFMWIVYGCWKGNPAMKCAWACGLVLPSFSAGVCCLSVGAVVTWFAKRTTGRLPTVTQSNPPIRMDVPILGGIVLGTTLSCLLTPKLCAMMCRYYQIALAPLPCRGVLPAFLFACLSSALVFAYVFDEVKRDEWRVTTKGEEHEGRNP